MGSTQSLKFCSILAPNLALFKTTTLVKTKISAKTTSQRKSQVPQNHRFFCKIKQNKFFFGSKLGLNFPLWSRQRVIRNLHIVYYRNISLNVLDAKFQFLFIFCSHFYLEEALRFPGLGLK